jgi:hypothetical protein
MNKQNSTKIKFYTHAQIGTAIQYKKEEIVAVSVH